jgi:hypothetical protein
MAVWESVEREVLLDQYGRILFFLRRFPNHAVHYLSGIALPPHERLWLSTMFDGYRINNRVASRGTSKSFVHGSVGMPFYGLLTKDVKAVLLSASGFRGGQLLFDDAERFFLGTLRDQESPGPFLASSVDGANIVKRMPSKWSIHLSSQSMMLTVPTNNPEKLRGIRSNFLVSDEHNFVRGSDFEAVVNPMMNVGGSFRRTSTAGDDSQIFKVSTIDYTHRDWYKELEAARRLALREYEAQQALARGEVAEYERLMETENGALRTGSESYSRLDYTDLLIPTEITCLDGHAYSVNYPLTSDLSAEDVVKFDEREQRHLIYTYPVNKAFLEKPLFDGTGDREIWLAENRNQFIAAAGNVFPWDLIQKTAERPVISLKAGSGDDEVLEDLFAPVMYSCGDPCILGADYARESDHAALVVIRLGSLAEGKFQPWLLRDIASAPTDAHGRPLLGHTPWNSVVWAEAHVKMEDWEFAARIRSMRERYNLYSMDEVRAIAMDKMGGGVGVRDELAQPGPRPDAQGRIDPEWVAPVRIFDPEDGDYAHFAANAMDEPDRFWGGLELIKPTSQGNADMVYGARALMQQRKLYIGYAKRDTVWAKELGLITASGLPDTASPDYHRWAVGYLGVARLAKQLAKVQSKVAENGGRRFFIPGDKTSAENKKDLFSAFIYASYLARKHLVSKTKTEDPTDVADIAPIAVSMPSWGLF